MHLGAVCVSSTDILKSVAFYSLLGFAFEACTKDDQHVEGRGAGETKLMLDSASLLKEILGTDPKPSTHSAFAIECDSPKEVDQVAEQITAAGFTVHKAPWDAFWGQRYCIVQDPDGYLVDVYAQLQ